MKLNVFKNKDKSKETDKKIKDVAVEETVQEETSGNDFSGSTAFSGSVGVGAHKILRGFYVSEKSSLANASNQYVFKVFKNANKSEVKKEVSRIFKVEVKNIRMLNMPSKRRDFGKHPGIKTGFKKAIVVLKEGFTIGQAKP